MQKFVIASVLALGVGTSALAAPPSPSPRPFVLPWTFAPDAEGIEAIPAHAAGLGLLEGGAELGVAWTTRLSGRDPVSSLGLLGGTRLGPIALGLGVSGIGDGPGTKTSTTRVDLAVALRFSPRLAIGFQWFDLGSKADALVDDYSAFSLSASWRPLRAMSLALGLEHLNRPINPASPSIEEDPVARLSIALRPGTERFTFGLEGARTITDGDGLWQAMVTARAMILPGWALGGWARYENLEGGGAEDISGGLMLGLYQGTLGLETGVDVSNRDETPMQLSSLLRFGGDRKASLSPGRKQVYHLKLSGPLPERPSTSLFGDPRPGFAHWLLVLEMVAEDPRVTGLVLQIDQAPSWAQCWELRRAIGRIKAAGKKVLALETVGDMRAHYLASAADEIHLLAAGGLMLTGLAITQTYYLGLMEKLGVKAEFVKFDEYKTAPEPFSRTGPSDPSKEQTQALLAGIDAEWISAVAEGRKLDAAALRQILEAGPQSMHVAKSSRLVDGLVESDQLGQLVETVFGKDVVLVDRYVPLREGWRRWGGTQRIAILPVTGSIVDGGSGGDLPLPIPFVGGETTGDASFAQALEAAVRDPSVAAIVIRVVSGGGSAVASDRMNRAVLSAKQKKPVIVSFGDVAASGGYYLAAGAPILMTPVTITGSIGIFSGKVDLSGLFALLGLSTYTTKTNERADMMGSHRPFTDAERDAAKTTLRAYYDRFVAVVAKGRNMSEADVDKIARGRVWLGKDALAKNLGDAEGGLWDAVRRARAEAGLGDDDPVDIAYVGTLGALSSLQRVLASVAGLATGEDAEAAANAQPHAPLPPELRELGAVYGALAGDGPLAMMPFKLTFD
ncbi:MAG: S49 family peptidase [Deltaproteobacteria bacterium]|nr:S49 family peptidase [Deltaproteobacteria bacterium]